MNPPDSFTPAAPERPPLGVRFLRRLAALVLALGLVIICSLAAVGYVPGAFAALEQSWSLDTRAAKFAVLAVLLAAVLLPLVLLVVARRKRWFTPPLLAVAAVFVAGVLGWLAWDDAAVRRPLTLEELSPAFPGAEASYTVLMRYSKQTPSPEAVAFGKATLTPLSWGAGATREPANWIAAVTKNRATIEANWNQLAPERAWAAELNVFDRIGDLTPARFDANLPLFQAWRALSQHTCAIATLQALDGHGDDAVATLLPMLELGRKLQPSARTLVRAMIGVVIERMCLETAGIILDHAAVSPARRAALAAALAGDNAPAGARRLLLIEYAQLAPALNPMRVGTLVTDDASWTRIFRRPLDLVSSLFFNPNATANLYGRQVFELAALAEARELGQFAVRTRTFDRALSHGIGMKNVGGRLILQMTTPAYGKVVESYWQTADLRAALRSRLAPAAS
ncbi:MAG TPA: hypothetical protein VHE13_11750 [Opitutus sp.]|nr:hypothetical protein [Opitutus sp.]